VAKKKKTTNAASNISLSDEFTTDLIKQLNKENGENIAFNLSTDDAPTNIKRWISTGSRQLDSIISNQVVGGFPEGRIVEIQGPTSCHAAGDRVLLYDGRTIAVEHVKVGDKLLGPDGSPRKVLECHSGEDEMYEIRAARGGKTYTVNQHHLLHLQRAYRYTKNEHSPRNKANDVLNIPVREYLTKSGTFKKMYRQKRTTIEQFHGRKLPETLSISPYVLGLLLGDGSLKEHRIELTTADDVIKRTFCEFVEQYGFEAKFHCKKDTKATGIYYTTGIRSNQFLYEDQKETRPYQKCASDVGIVRFHFWHQIHSRYL